MSSPAAPAVLLSATGRVQPRDEIIRVRALCDGPATAQDMRAWAVALVRWPLMCDPALTQYVLVGAGGQWSSPTRANGVLRLVHELQLMTTPERVALEMLLGRNISLTVTRDVGVLVR